jgi:hypothetical protein
MHRKYLNTSKSSNGAHSHIETVPPAGWGEILTLPGTRWRAFAQLLRPHTRIAYGGASVIPIAPAPALLLRRMLLRLVRHEPIRLAAAERIAKGHLGGRLLLLRWAGGGGCLRGWRRLWRLVYGRGYGVRLGGRLWRGHCGALLGLFDRRAVGRAGVLWRWRRAAIHVVGGAG